MANPEHVEILKQGVKIWNHWREKNEAVLPDLSEENLRRADLRKINLVGANLSKPLLDNANLRKATLSDAIIKSASFSSVDLNGANLIRVNFGGTNLSMANLSRAPKPWGCRNDKTTVAANNNRVPIAKFS